VGYSKRGGDIARDKEGARLPAVSQLTGRISTAPFRFWSGQCARNFVLAGILRLICGTVDREGAK
jgi:hypothetical protein